MNARWEAVKLLLPITEEYSADLNVLVISRQRGTALTNQDLTVISIEPFDDVLMGIVGTGIAIEAQGITIEDRTFLCVFLRIFHKIFRPGSGCRNHPEYESKGHSVRVRPYDTEQISRHHTASPRCRNREKAIQVLALRVSSCFQESYKTSGLCQTLD